MYDLLSNTNIYKNTYAELICWVRQLSSDIYYNNQKVLRAEGLQKLNHEQAAIIMELEWRLRMAEKEYGTAQSSVVTHEQFKEWQHRNRTGLKSGGEPPQGDWLSPMKIGTEFLVSPKQQQNNWVLSKFMHAGVRNDNVLIIPMLGEEPNQDPKEWVWVDPIRFCKFWEFKGFILIPEENE